MRVTEDAHAHVREARDTTHSRFQEACAVLRHDAALIETSSKHEPSQDTTR
ncbi:hypothetical protein AB0J51_16020 [Micromonospora echinofusca]|uniref:hypothetical protein n=1 Tax=Micromonospora echinofusca TaxID=47858 RepID=UPI003445A7B2